LKQLASGNGDKRHALKETKNQLYETPPEAVHALLEVEDVPQLIWEPACGPGSIVRVLRAAGRQVYATDLVDYDSPDQDMAGWDFLLERQLPLGAQAIVTNPPFKNATEFARKAIELCPRVYMLMRLAFLEGSSRSDIMDGGDLARVYVFRNRLPMMHRDGWAGPKSTNTMAFAWFCWRRGWANQTELRRVSWKPLAPRLSR
jgi:hypothetical protein